MLDEFTEINIALVISVVALVMAVAGLCCVFL